MKKRGSVTNAVWLFFKKRGSMEIDKVFEGKYILKRKYGGTIAFFFEYLELTDVILESLRGRRAELSADGDFFILYVEVDQK